MAKLSIHTCIFITIGKSVSQVKHNKTNDNVCDEGVYIYSVQRIDY